jgi:predicted DNA-binding transcriptional regulator YafY
MSRKPTYPAATNLLSLTRMLLESYYGVISFNEITERLEISDKTLKRYLGVMEYAFGDLIAVRTGAELGRQPENERYLEFKRYALESRTGYQLAPLYLSRFFMSFLEGTLLDESFSEAVALFESAVEHPPSSVRVGDFANKFFAISHGPKSYAEHDETIETILQGLVKQNPLLLVYRKPGAAGKEYRVEPLTLLMYKQGLYLIASNPEWDRPHFFAVERIREISRLKDESFDYPSDYSPQELCRGSFGIFVGEEVDVVIRFSPTVPREYIVTRRWHKSQTVEETDDGSLILRMRVSGLPELAPWVLSFGGSAEVLEPESLRNEVVQEAQRLMDVYR